MTQNFIEGCREQGFLLPPDVREWLPADHLAWFVIDAAGEMDLSAFYAAYRADGHGRSAYELEFPRFGGQGLIRPRWPRSGSPCSDGYCSVSRTGRARVARDCGGAGGGCRRPR